MADNVSVLAAKVCVTRSQWELAYVWPCVIVYPPPLRQVVSTITAFPACDKSLVDVNIM